MQEMLLRYRIGRWMSLRRRAARPGDEATARMRARFARRYGEVCDSCAVLEPDALPQARRLAGEYMARVLRDEREPGWWQAHDAECTAPWFIWQYCLDKEMVARPEPEPVDIGIKVLRPETVAHEGCVRIWLERMPADGRLGVLYVEYDKDEGAFYALMRAQGLRRSGGKYSRRIYDWCAPVFDRAAESAVCLLEQGYAVAVDEPGLARAIEEESFTPEHRYWVLACARADMLRLNYPRDQRLHSYVCRAGGYWNGRYMEISICNADRIEELAQMYGFKCTDEARRRLDAWHEAVRSATIFRPRRGKKKKVDAVPMDMFREIMGRSLEVISDLRDENE